MARVEGYGPRGSGDEKTPRKSSERVTSHRVEVPTSGRRGRFGYYSGFRPSRHRWFGFALIVGGALIAVLNDAMLFMNSTVLPFGHQELWLITGMAVAASGTWFLGLFDPSVRRRRHSG